MTATCLASFSRCVLFMLLTSAPLQAATTFDYTLPASHRPYWTSAGVFKTDGTLVRTLWRKEIQNAGSFSAAWDDLDDEGNPAPAATYELRVLHHQIDYVWDGVIGNTSADASGPTVHGNFYPIRDMAVSGAQGFYVADYNEATYDYHSFLTADPLRLTDRWLWLQDIRGPGQAGSLQKGTNNIANRSWNLTASDGAWVYIACPASTDPTVPYPRAAQHWNSHRGFVMACDATTHAQAYFTNGQLIPNGQLQRQDNGDGTYTDYEGSPYFPFPNGVYVGSQPGVSGMAVQAAGNVLAIAVEPDNKVYFLHKRTGAALGEISVPSPRRVEIGPDGDLWVCSGTSVIRYTALETAPVQAGSITNLVKPLDVAIHPTADLVMIADGGTSQQIKAFTSAGDAVWTHGLAGGQRVLGPAVQNNIFWFTTGKLSNDTTADREDTFISVQPDGSFWVGDGGNWRVLHFSPERGVQHTLAFQPHSYSCCVDEGNPQRVFSGFLEFAVDYSKPLTQGWQLVRNWAWNLSQDYHGRTTTGIRAAATLSNGRTYAMVTRWVGGAESRHVAELTAGGLRLTPATFGGNEGMGPDGTMRTYTPNAANWTQRVLGGFDSNGDPQYSASQFLASATTGPLDPAPHAGIPARRFTPVTSSGIVVSFDAADSGGSPAVPYNNFHLGGIRAGGTSWLWRASPAVTALDNRGGFEVSATSLTYAANTAVSAGRHIVYSYHGEFFRNQRQAGQFMHWWDNGLFLGQFGESNLTHDAWEGKVPGFVGNSLSPDFIRAANGEHYVFANDENGHGVQRWHLAGAQTIRELTGQVSPGGSVTLSALAPAFPSITSAFPGNGRATLTWSPVPGAQSYRVRFGIVDGGPYEQVMEVPAISATFAELANGLPHYFTVSAVTGNAEGPASAQARVFPLDTAQTVQLGGGWRTTLRPLVYKIGSAAPAQGRSAVTAQTEVIGDVSLPELFHRSGSDGQLPVIDFGKQGYVFFNYSGTGVDNANILAPFTVARPSSGWLNDNRFAFWFHIDGTAQTSDYGVKTTTSGAVNIGASNNGPTDWHCLTVALPRQSADARHSILRLSPQGQAGVQAEYDTGRQAVRSCFSDVVQFLFRGPVTLTLQKGTASVVNASIQGMFLDDVPITAALTPLETWKSNELGNTSASDTADTDGDGLKHLAEYMLGLSTSVSDTAASAIEQAFIGVGGTDYLTITFPRDPARYDVDCTVEASGDCQSWTPVAASIRGMPMCGPGYVMGDGNGPGLKRVTVRDTMSMVSGPRRFLRLKFTR